MLENKDRIQDQALQAWINNNKIGTLTMGTGVGKTKIGLLAAHRIYDLLGEQTSILIVVPTTNLKDNEWVNEIDKWFPYLKPYITIECIQTAYKKLDLVDLLIVDEIHSTLSTEYRKLYSVVEYGAILGLTATPPHNKEYAELLNQICPIIFKCDMSEARELNLISGFKIINTPINLTKGEKKKYNMYDKMFNTALIQLSAHGNAFDVANEAKNDKTNALYAVASRFWLSMTQRRWICYKAENKLKACLDIILANPYKKWIVFSHQTDFADKLAKLLLDEGILAVSYHSKLNKAQRIAALDTAKCKLCSVICSAQALNAGYNLPDIDGATCASSTSTELTFVQSLGRTTRLDENNSNKISIFINLYANFTQERTWIVNKAKNLEVIELDLKKLLSFLKE